MAQDYVEYLAVHVLNEQQLVRKVSYRSLSRALKVHSNLAKQMLYDFHRKQNAKKLGSVHATYLVSGSKQPDADAGHQDERDGDDTVMQSSPFLPSSSMPHPDSTDEDANITHHSIVLVREEELESVKAKFRNITSIHVYSLQATSMSDLCTLSECNRRIAVDYSNEDGLKDWAQYGTIQNPFVKRRERRGNPPPPQPAIPIVKTGPQSTRPIKQESTSAGIQPRQPAATSSNKATPDPEPKTTGKAASKQQSSSIFKSFAKTKAVPKKEESQDSAPPSQAPEETPAADFSDEEDGEAVEASIVENGAAAEPTGKSKKEREAELQAMMEQEDEEMEDAPDVEAEDDKDNTIDQIPTEPEEPSQTVTVENGRRRGRRRIMKKKTVKDEDGYLVTREEAAWESFSEEEPAAKKVKGPTAVNSKSASNAKKPASKPGQGNIMSFFSKK